MAKYVYTHKEFNYFITSLLILQQKRDKKAEQRLITENKTIIYLQIGGEMGVYKITQ